VAILELQFGGQWSGRGGRNITSFMSQIHIKIILSVFTLVYLCHVTQRALCLREGILLWLGLRLP